VPRCRWRGQRAKLREAEREASEAAKLALNNPNNITTKLLETHPLASSPYAMYLDGSIATLARVPTGAGFFYGSTPVRFAERGFQQASGVALAKSCRNNNSHGDTLSHHLTLAGTLKLFKGGVQNFSHFRKCLGFKCPE
jgi:hypothetical protein